MRLLGSKYAKMRLRPGPAGVAHSVPQRPLVGFVDGKKGRQEREGKKDDRGEKMAGEGKGP